MSKVVITDSNEFERIIGLIEESYRRIIQIFEEEKNNIELINETDIWTSKTQKVIYDKIKLLQTNYEPINESIGLFIEFLKKTIDDYKRFEKITLESENDNQINLDINS